MKHTHVKAILAFFLIFISTYTVAHQDNPFKGSIVKVSSTRNAFNYKSPWQSPVQMQGTATGFVIGGNKILTNAHVVANSAFITIKNTEGATPFKAKVEMVDHEVDLALLSVEDESFFEGITPFEIGTGAKTRDKVYVVGFPLGGEEYSVTEGVVSRIEMHIYAHSGGSFLIAQIDAAINPGNSGGPVLHEGKVVGVATQSIHQAQNMGFMIPVDIVQHFLDDYHSGHYKGFPDAGLIIQAMENPSLRARYKMTAEDSGILVRHVSAMVKNPTLQEGDVILAIDDVKVANNGTILVDNELRIRADYLVKRSYVGKVLKMDIIRDGKKKTIQYPLVHKHNQVALVPNVEFDVEPTYFVHGGLVFQPLTINYLQSYGENWAQLVPSYLIYYLQHGKKTDEFQEVVILNRVLPDNVNMGYEYMQDLVITKVNGVSVKSLTHLSEIIKDNKSPTLSFLGPDNELVVIDAKMANLRNNTIFKQYSVTSGQSQNIKTA